MKDLILYDINKELCKEWEILFKDIPNVKIKNCSFEKLECEYVVTAGNSFGWMTGGIDLAVRNYYGVGIQDIIQRDIIRMVGSILPVGEHILIKTNDKLKPNLIYVPTMLYPRVIQPIDIYYVFYKLLSYYDSFACCGLGTATGGLTAKQCAETMYKVYTDFRRDIRNE